LEIARPDPSKDWNFLSILFQGLEVSLRAVSNDWNFF